jgi:hypothetical protein
MQGLRTGTGFARRALTRNPFRRRSADGLQPAQSLRRDRKAKADAEATPGRRPDPSGARADAKDLIAAWNERQARHMPLLFAPTIGAAVTARQHFLWVYCPVSRTTRDIDLRTLDRHRHPAVTKLIPWLSWIWICRSARIAASPPG